MPLADTLADVFLVMGQSQLIQFSFRLKVDDFEFLAAMLEAVAQDIDKTLHINCVLKGLIKFLLWIALAAFFKQCPLYWLSILDKGTQRFNIQCVVFRKNSGVIILKSRAIPYVCGFLPAAFGRNQKGFYILFKLFFVIWHYYTSRMFTLRIAINALAILTYPLFPGHNLINKGFLIGFQICNERFFFFNKHINSCATII